MIKVLIVDDSAFMRQLFTKTINNTSDLKAIDTARNGERALKKIPELKPDVITLDVEMPKKNGIETLQEIKENYPNIPVIMVSAVDSRENVLKALEEGAFDFIPKPSGSISLNIDDIKQKLVNQIKSAANSDFNGNRKNIAPTCPEKVSYSKKDQFPLIAIGSSSGGPKALKHLLSPLPGNLPAAIIIVQHMPAGFTASLAKRLDQISSISVKEASEGDYIQPGAALIAPGDYHLEVTDGQTVTLNKKSSKWGVRPCVDYMMQSAAPIYRQNIIGVILTGMGHDGAQGMKAIKKYRGQGIVEDKSTALVYGMPSATIKEKAYDFILPLDKIPAKLIDLIERS
ncbi:MAG: protein-glutamate methylesterase/protein-glutamine glutaminase [Halanaerobiales bacterium]